MGQASPCTLSLKVFKVMTNKQDITVLKSQLEPEKALKERHQQHRTTPCAGNAPLAMKPQRSVIRLISFDYALSGLSGLDDIAHPVRRALPSIIQNSKFIK
jgi:hypothetical protein